MLEVLGRDVSLGGVSRRSFLRIGSLGLAGLSLPEVLASESRKDTAIILFWMAGGPSHIDTYDMKPAAPAEVRGPFKPIATRLPGFQVCELLPRHAQLADRFSIVRSIRHTLGVHDDASHWVQTGYPLLQARERGQQNPAQGAVISKIRGPNRRKKFIILPSVRKKLRIKRRISKSISRTEHPFPSTERFMNRSN